MSIKNNIKNKINLLGDPSVGKTSLIVRYVKNIFNEDYLKTIGTNIYKKELETIDAKQKLIIQDIMGEQNYTIVQRNAFEGSSGAIAVADTTNEKTLESLVDNWIPYYREIAGENPPIILAINKCDLQNKEVVYDTIINGYEDEFDGFLFTSAKTGHSVEELFKKTGELSIYHAKANRKNIEKILYEFEMNTPKDLLSAGLALSSELPIMPYKTREEILKESGIDKYSLDKEISESGALHFVSGLSNWYHKKACEEFEDGLKAKGKLFNSSNIFLKLIYRYFKNK